MRRNSVNAVIEWVVDAPGTRGSTLVAPLLGVSQVLNAIVAVSLVDMLAIGHVQTVRDWATLMSASHTLFGYSFLPGLAWGIYVGREVGHILALSRAGDTAMGWKLIRRFAGWTSVVVLPLTLLYSILIAIEMAIGNQPKVSLLAIVAFHIIFNAPFQAVLLAIFMGLVVLRPDGKRVQITDDLRL